MLLAVAASMYAVYHGPDGLRRIAEHVNDKARTLAAGLRAGGIEVIAEEFFDTVVAHVPGRAADVVKAAHADGIHLRGSTTTTWASRRPRPRPPATWPAC